MFVLSIAGLNIVVRLMLPDDQTLLLLSIILIPWRRCSGFIRGSCHTLLATFTLGSCRPNP